MIESREYALKRLDKWYADRFRKNYTEEVAEKIIGSLFTRMIKSGEIGLGKDLLSTGSANGYTREGSIKKAEKYFSQTYATLETIMDGGAPESSVIKRMAPSVREEYVEPVLRAGKKLKDFVDRVRKKSGEIIPEDLSDDDINQAFLDVYGSHRGLTKFCFDYMNAIPLALNLAVIRGELPKKAFDVSVKFIEISKDALSYMNEMVFGDLGQDIKK